MEPIQMAFKEWAVIVEALGRGEQMLILRKGGIAEEKGLFTPDHARFWLYPTYLHEHRDGIKPEALPLLQRVEKQKPNSPVIPFTYFAEVSNVYRIDQLERLQRLHHKHIWSAETVEKRFHYRTPGLFVLAVRVWQVANTIQHLAKPEYDGCKTWVDLQEPISTTGAAPVLADDIYSNQLADLQQLIAATDARS